MPSYIIRRKDGEEDEDDCPACEGKGRVDCENCKGEGNFPCEDCGGNGECKHCGEGTCPSCEGARYFKCSKCHGDGEHDCPKCNGIGQVTVYLTEIPKGKEAEYERVWTYPTEKEEKQLPLIVVK